MHLLLAEIKLHDGTLPDRLPKSNRQVAERGRLVGLFCEQMPRAYLEVYFLDFLIPFSYEEIDGGYFLIVRAYEKIGKIYEKV